MSEANLPPSTVCYNHPDRETGLRCARCERPICPSCAVQTPTGYRCKECVKKGQKVFETAQWSDYPLAMIVAGVLALIGSFVATLLGFWIIFVAPVAGVIISEAVRLVIRKRRSPKLFKAAAAAVALGCLPLILINLVTGLIGLSAGAGAGGLISLVWLGIYAFFTVSTTYYRLSGIQLKR
jgi:hypothetical protein